MTDQNGPLERFQTELLRSELMAELVDTCAGRGLTVRVDSDGQRLVIEIGPAQVLVKGGSDE